MSPSGRQPRTRAQATDRGGSPGDSSSARLSPSCRHRVDHRVPLQRRRHRPDHRAERRTDRAHRAHRPRPSRGARPRCPQGPTSRAEAPSDASSEAIVRTVLLHESKSRPPPTTAEFPLLLPACAAAGPGRPREQGFPHRGSSGTASARMSCRSVPSLPDAQQSAPLGHGQGTVRVRLRRL